MENGENKSSNSLDKPNENVTTEQFIFLKNWKVALKSMAVLFSVLSTILVAFNFSKILKQIKTSNEVQKQPSLANSAKGKIVTQEKSKGLNLVLIIPIIQSQFPRSKAPYYNPLGEIKDDQFIYVLNSFNRNIKPDLVLKIRDSIKILNYFSSSKVLEELRASTLALTNTKLQLTKVENRNHAATSLMMEMAFNEFNQFNLEDNKNFFFLSNFKIQKPFSDNDDPLNSVLNTLLKSQYAVDVYERVFQARGTVPKSLLLVKDFLINQFNMIIQFYSLYFDVVSQMNEALFQRINFHNFISPSWIFRNRHELFDSDKSIADHLRYFQEFKDFNEAYLAATLPVEKLNDYQKNLVTNFSNIENQREKFHKNSMLASSFKKEHLAFNFRLPKQLFMIFIISLLLGCLIPYLKLEWYRRRANSEIRNEN